MVAGVDFSVESESSGISGDDAGLHVQLLGPLTIRRRGQVVPLPPSRKLRALIAYMALAPHELSREQLCELLWDIPNDPRGELRGCLSKARAILDDDDHRRVRTSGDRVWLQLDHCDVDVLAIGGSLQHGVQAIPTLELQRIHARYLGEFLQGTDLPRCASFSTWLTAQRRRWRAYHVAVLEQLVSRVPSGSDAASSYLDAWLQLAPFDRRAHELLLQGLGRRGQIKEAEEHLGAAVRAFEEEGLDWHPLRTIWREAKTRVHQSVGEAPLLSPESLSPAQADGHVAQARRASIAVMPFIDHEGQTRMRGGAADGLAHDIITRLAKLRSLFVIAQGTVFTLDQRSVGPEEAGRTLNVDYVVGGQLRRDAHRIRVDVELLETRTNSIVWADTCDYKLDDTLVALEEISDRIVASVAGQIESVERKRAILKPPNSLDAWEAFHRGLWHMYRFNREDNAQARYFFEMAVRLDPTFSRAHAALSFTHWQNAFQTWGEPKEEALRAFNAAGLSLLADDRDPAAHWAMGRALWLRGEHQQSLSALQTSVDLSPNFALGHYTLGFVDCQAGDAESAIKSADHSWHLSPYDPLLFGMLAVRALALVRLGRFDEATEWALRAAARPNAHIHIQAIAAGCLSIAGRLVEAKAIVSHIRHLVPQYGISDFLASFQLSDESASLFRAGAKRIDFE